MQQTKPKTITEEHWREAVDAYELGTKHAVQIAADLGVSSATVSREFKRRGARKACRVAESVAELEAVLEVKARRRACRRRVEEAAAMERLAAINNLIDDMVKSVFAAQRTGNLAAAAAKVAEVGATLGVKRSR